MAGGRVCVDRNPGNDTADATLRLPYQAAVGLASGTRTAHDVLLAGEVTFDGDPARLQELAAALGAIAAALGPLRDATVYP